jgi:hypothetical protein
MILHSGFISSIHKDSLTSFYTTTTENETITFTDQNDIPQNLNSLTIISNESELYIQILPSEYCIYLPANSTINIDLCNIKQIKVLGVANQNLRWFGLYD